MRSSETRVELDVGELGQHSVERVPYAHPSSLAIKNLKLAYLHFRASISLPGVSRHLRIKCVCCRTTASASSRRRAWSSIAGGEAMMASAGVAYATAENRRSVDP